MNTDKKAKFKCRPHFVLPYIFILNLPFILFLMLSVVPMYTTMILALDPASAPTLVTAGDWMMFLFPPVIFLIGGPLLTGCVVLWTYFTYNATRYSFHDDHLQYTESFLNIEEKELRFQRVIEVGYTQNVLQRFFKIGTVVISTAAEGAQTRSTGLKIRDLESPREAHARIKELINAAQGR